MAEIILGIDTSCDDTSIAVVEKTKGKFNILSNVVSSQVKLHQKYGGVYPTLAKREHQKNLPKVLEQALKKAGLRQTRPALAYIALTIGPGLEPCLWQGINFAIDLAKKWRLAIIPINHLEGHLIAALLSRGASNFQWFGYAHHPELAEGFSISNFQKLLPAMALVVSGGNTQLALVKKIGQYQVIGETRDDAAGECFDKTARVLGLTYPGGPAIAAEASVSNRADRHGLKQGLFDIKLPRPMLYTKDYDFSFSGLKTAVLYDYKKRPAKTRKSKKYIQTMAKEIQLAVIDVLTKKTLRAACDFKVKSILLGGGVACNQELRKQFQQKISQKKLSFKFQVPSFKLCADNAAMVALTGFFHQNRATRDWLKLRANSSLKLS